MRPSLSRSPGKWARDVRATRGRQGGQRALGGPSDGPGGGGLSPPPAGSADAIAAIVEHLPVQRVPGFAASFLPTVAAVRVELLGAPGGQAEEHLSQLQCYPGVLPRAPGQAGGPGTGWERGGLGQPECQRSLPRRAPRGRSCARSLRPLPLPSPGDCPVPRPCLGPSSQ